MIGSGVGSSVRESGGAIVVVPSDHRKIRTMHIAFRVVEQIRDEHESSSFKNSSFWRRIKCSEVPDLSRVCLVNFIKEVIETMVTDDLRSNF